MNIKTKITSLAIAGATTLTFAGPLLAHAAGNDSTPATPAPAAAQAPATSSQIEQGDVDFTPVDRAAAEATNINGGSYKTVGGATVTYDKANQTLTYSK
ncbi:MAG: hypothetical protein LBN08_04910 [Lactobacillales bacterium]|jgi:hypothetical protein|nr:hypothetical protein [Lactobacillales bacterium]